MKLNKRSLHIALGVGLALTLAVTACARAMPTPTPQGFDRPAPTATPTLWPVQPPRPTPTPMPRPAATPTPTPPARRVSYEAGPIERVIVRTVDMTLVVEDLSRAMDSIGALATEMGGWVVSSSQLHMHAGSISIRVPAQRLDEVLDRLKRLARKVESAISTSQDFTDEYVDTQARVRNLQATEAALIGFLDKAESVEEALKVQAELTRVQEQIETLQGRLSYLEQSSAFSLVNVHLKLVEMSMQVDAGPDLTVKEGESVRFRASFTPPEGITDFAFEWDFGDGTPVVRGDRTAPEPDASSRTTATVTHVYRYSEDSPFIVTISITGSGDAGAAGGTDTLIATVVKVEPIEVYAGADMEVMEGEVVAFDGSFTRPVGLSDFQFRWDFGDGSAPVIGGVSEGTTAVATHVYPNYRPEPFVSTLTVTATSEAGAVEASDTVQVRVREPGSMATSWSPSDTLRSSVRALSAVGHALGRVFIWLGIFSPIWVGLLVVAYLARRRRRGA